MADDAGQPHRLRLTSIRGYMPNTVQLSGHQVRQLWSDRFAEMGPAHPYWLYTHIPFCPQICSFCQCSTSLRKSDKQVETYLQWLAGEIDFLCGSAASGLVKFQYIGGGTPNLLSDRQLEWLLGKLNQCFRFAGGARRTFEFLPSSLRPETLPLARAHGFNRLSCGVQSWSGDTLKAVNRSQAGLDDLGRTIETAYALGYDEFNLDLIHGIGNESRDQFLAGLLEVLALRPTTLTIHHVIPTATNPVFASVAEELAAYGAFENLERSLGEAVARRFPHMQWVLRPNSWILVDRAFLQRDDFSPWYYSDNERIHIDMLSFGRFAHSNILGRVSYENLSFAERYEPSETSYRAFRKAPVIDAALDVITDLVGDRHSDLEPIHRRYGDAGLRPLQPILEGLQADGLLVRKHGAWEPVSTDGVFIDPFWPIMEAAVREIGGPWKLPSSKDTDSGIRIGVGDQSLVVFVEKLVPDKRYFTQIGRLGIYYRQPDQTQRLDREDWVGVLMEEFLAEVRQLLEAEPNVSVKQVTAKLRRRFQADSLSDAAVEI